VPRLVVSDLTQPDRTPIASTFRDADAVIHCGFVRAPGMTADTWQDNKRRQFQADTANVASRYTVYRVALEEGVRRVVVCAQPRADYYERLVWDGASTWPRRPDRCPPRPDNWYGWSKAAYELSRLRVRTGKMDGRRLEVVQWRRSAARDTTSITSSRAISRQCIVLGAYLSAPIRRSRPSGWWRRGITDDNGVPFLIVYASAATPTGSGAWPAPAQDRLPSENDSQVNFAEKIAAIARCRQAK